MCFGGGGSQPTPATPAPAPPPAEAAPEETEIGAARREDDEARYGGRDGSELTRRSDTSSFGGARGGQGLRGTGVGGTGVRM